MSNHNDLASVIADSVSDIILNSDDFGSAVLTVINENPDCVIDAIKGNGFEDVVNDVIDEDRVFNLVTGHSDFEDAVREIQREKYSGDLSDAVSTMQDELQMEMEKQIEKEIESAISDLSFGDDIDSLRTDLDRVLNMMETMHSIMKKLDKENCDLSNSVTYYRGLIDRLNHRWDNLCSIPILGWIIRKFVS